MMASRSTEEEELKKKTPSSQSTESLLTFDDEDDDDFQDPATHPLHLTQTTLLGRSRGRSSSCCSRISFSQPLKPSNSAVSRPPKKPKRHAGKENLDTGGTPLLSLSNTPPLFRMSSNPPSTINTRQQVDALAPDLDLDCSLDVIKSTIDSSYRVAVDASAHAPAPACNSTIVTSTNKPENMALYPKGGFSYSSNSIESRLLRSRVNCAPNVCVNDGGKNQREEFEPGPKLDVLLKLCTEEDQHPIAAEFLHCKENGSDGGLICCPMCGVDISSLTHEMRQVHTNECLDEEETPDNVVLPDVDAGLQYPRQVLDASPARSPRQAFEVCPVREWLCSLGLARYAEIFVKEEVDWDTLQWLTEEDLLSLGVTALGPRKKIVHALSELRKGSTKSAELQIGPSEVISDETDKLLANKLITDYFPGFVTDRKKGCNTSGGRNEVKKHCSDSSCKHVTVKNQVTKGKPREIPLWCCIAGTPFRVDAFKYLRRDCSYWFLTHFHIDHYQGLTRSFCHGKIYCSLITARLVNLKIGIPWDRLQVLPLSQKISIAGVDVTCFDANHCPGSILILFEPPSGKAVLHTGDFRLSEEMMRISILQTCPVHTLILDSTYCDPQYDFPKQDAVIQFVIEAIQAEAFNPKTLFLIGSYTIGKERLFVEVARVLRKKVYVTAAKLRLLECLGLSSKDMQWFTLNEQESQIHVVPMWTLASFKRLKHVSNQYAGRFSLIVAFSPTGWTFGKGKKKSPGRRWQQGTTIRYEVPYSEHCSFTELKEFVKFISPVNIIPSVNNNGPESSSMMVSHLLS